MTGKAFLYLCCCSRAQITHNKPTIHHHTTLFSTRFGKSGTSSDEATRNQFYQLIYSIIQQDAQSGGPSAGALFWLYYADGQVAPESKGPTEGTYPIFDSDATFQTIDGFTASMRALTGQAVAGCSVPNGVQLPALKNCSSTWVNGRPGTGMEGPTCQTDINECVRGTAGCAAVGSACVNTEGGYECSCTLGYQGDGFSCAATAALQALQANYSTAGQAQLACQEGSDVPYPEGAPGFAYDPTGGAGVLNGASSAASLVSVQPVDCMAACTQAGDCTSFSYNPTLQKCFLKTGGSSAICQVLGWRDSICVRGWESTLSLCCIQQISF